MRGPYRRPPAHRQTTHPGVDGSDNAVEVDDGQRARQVGQVLDERQQHVVGNVAKGSREARRERQHGRRQRRRRACAQQQQNATTSTTMRPSRNDARNGYGQNASTLGAGPIHAGQRAKRFAQ